MGRRKGNSTFPVARIKKMMQSDDDVGKIATVTPVLVAKALECMMEYVLQEAARVALDKSTKTVTPQHLKACVMQNDSFDFLRDVLGAVPEDVQKKRSRSPGAPAPKRRRRVKNDPPAEKATVQPTTPELPPQQLTDVVHAAAESSISLSLPSSSTMDVAAAGGGEEDEEDYDEEEEETSKGGAADRVSVQALVS